jgi:hypothetical protein
MVGVLSMANAVLSLSKAKVLKINVMRNILSSNYGKCAAGSGVS